MTKRTQTAVHQLAGYKQDAIRRNMVEMQLESASHVFAEHLAAGLTPVEAARAMGRGQDYGNAIMQRIRKRLGPQAR